MHHTAAGGHPLHIADAATGERALRPELGIARRIQVEVVHAEEEGVGGGPLEAQRHSLQHEGAAGWLRHQAERTPVAMSNNTSVPSATR